MTTGTPKSNCHILAKRGVGLSFLPIGIAVLVTGCASLRPDAFSAFETSVATAQKGLETEMARDVEWTREADVNTLAEDKGAPLSDYMLKEVDGFSWSFPVTTPHGEARQTQRVLTELNAAFLGYAKLLTLLAMGQPKEAAQQEALAAAINQSLRDAKEAKAGLKPEDKLPLAGVSAFVSEGWLSLTGHVRAKDLRTAVLENQSWVEEYAKQCLDLVDLIQADLKAAYADRMEGIHNRWDDKRTPGRNTLARSIFNLNADYADAMDALQSLSLFYNSLPGAHRDLAIGLARPGKPQKALAELGAFAERVARLTQDLEKAR